MTYKKKLIEVALPLEAINKEAAREKSIRHGHPSTLHLWWARRPLAACRAVLFGSLVDDPSSHPDKFPTEEAQEKERQRLFRIIEDLVKWENSNDEEILALARQEILKSTDGNPPPVLDPFAGGGSIPLEAQRLGLEAHASDLNPVAVLINKALIEIPPKFAGLSPVHPDKSKVLLKENWRDAQGLAEDVRFYGQWMREEAFKRIGHLYPKVKLPKDMGGSEATVIAWIWARTVKCPNPACGAIIPMVSSFWLSKKEGKKNWVEPVVDKKTNEVTFTIASGKGEPPAAPKTGRGARFTCQVCGQVTEDRYVKKEGSAGRMGSQLMAIVAEGGRSRIYLEPNKEHEIVIPPIETPWLDQNLPGNARWFSPPLFGLDKYQNLFTPRQLVALTTFSDLVGEAREQVKRDALRAGMADDGKGLEEGGSGATAYADAVAVYLGCAVSRSTDFWSSLTTWTPSGEFIGHTFTRQALPMVWDYTEGNPFCSASGNWGGAIDWVARVIQGLPAMCKAKVSQVDVSAARDQILSVCTDPPYYDNIGYADLSDYFYVWLRRSVGKTFPQLFSTLLVPKAQELVATPYRFGGSKQKAQEFFETGLGIAFERMRSIQHPDFPLTVYYAFKQAESEENDETKVISSTGWETMLEGLLKAGFAISGTLPMRTERTARSISIGTNALASSIVLVCRPRPEDAPLATRREFNTTLKRELPTALKNLQHGGIAPVDFAQAAIGPGMAVFSRYSKVLEADGSPMSVRTALQVINEQLEAYLTESEGDLDRDTRFCVTWFEQHGHNEGPFGEADVLARAKNTSVEGLQTSGVLAAKAGKVRLLRRGDYPKDWDPGADTRLTVWECTQQLIKRLDEEGFEAAGKLAKRLGGGRSEDARALAYRLFAICEQKGWAEEALSYNMLAASWSDIQEAAATIVSVQHGQTGLF